MNYDIRTFFATIGGAYVTDPEQQQVWPNGHSPSDEWSEHATKRVLDELFCFAGQYRDSKSYGELLKFITRFRFYAPYNGMLVRTQLPGATFVAPAHRWDRKYGRTIKVNARPLVILQPMGPVMFVFDVSDTEAGPNAKTLPPEVTDPFAVRSGRVNSEWDRTIDNAKRDGVRIQPRKEGSQSAGSIRPSQGDRLHIVHGTDKDGTPQTVSVPLRFDILFNEDSNPETRYATLVHELGHLYCGHLGTPNRKWWPDRRGLDRQTAEFEAESVAYLVCKRLGIDTPSEQYLASYMRHNFEVPNISIDLVMKVAGLIEQMGQKRMELRKDK